MENLHLLGFTKESTPSQSKKIDYWTPHVVHAINPLKGSFDIEKLFKSYFGDPDEEENIVQWDNQRMRCFKDRAPPNFTAGNQSKRNDSRSSITNGNRNSSKRNNKRKRSNT